MFDADNYDYRQDFCSKSLNDIIDNISEISFSQSEFDEVNRKYGKQISTMQREYENNELSIRRKD